MSAFNMEGERAMKTASVTPAILLVPVFMALACLGCSKGNLDILSLIYPERQSFYSEVMVASSTQGNNNVYPALPPWPDSFGPVPEDFVYGEDVIYGRDYRVDRFTEEMKDNGLLATLDGKQYFFPLAKLCGRHLTVLHDDGHIAFMWMSCDR